MDPTINEHGEPGYLRAWKGVAFAIVLLVLLAMLGSYMLAMPNTIPSSPGNSSSAVASSSPETPQTPATTTSAVSMSIEIRGMQTCLKHFDTRGPQTTECAIGLHADDGYDYGLDTSLLQPDAIGEMYGGAHVRVVGLFTPIEALSSVQRYQMRGVVKVSIIERIQ